jgi:hypothetical protein
MVRRGFCHMISPLTSPACILLAISQLLLYTTHMTHEESRKELTPVQKRFCKEYVIDFNGRAAYQRASGTGNAKSAGVQACKLLKLPKVIEYYEAYAKEQLGPLEKDLMGNVSFWIEIRDSHDSRPADRLKASEMLAKYRSMFVEKKDLNITAAVTIQDDIA